MLANWTAKIANLLVEEVDAGPGTRVLIDVPVHWRSLVWVLGTWVTGATAVLDAGDGEGLVGDGADPDVVVTTRPERWLDECDVVTAVALPSFALRWPGTLPGAALDGSADVAAQPDALGPLAPASAGHPAIVSGGLSTSFAELAAGPASAQGLREGTTAIELALAIEALTASSGVVGLRG
ncbi:TIGR03089 family protein [Serinibacter arcticus]|uniref:TIGR03089 family protein n=1 Tax=Serinibacter arcticus TaxID=1655435 RepID=A0A2U1ZYQ6_9MICO|nr:TIGR03089 family protein [Serinibacter arcticus]